MGDKIKIGGTGRAYTVVGPLTISPWGDPTKGTLGNPELFVNVGAPGAKSPLVRSYCATNVPMTNPPTFTQVTTANPEFLFVVNGEDDDKDGLVDSGWDGFDGTARSGGPFPDGFVDDLAEWETEVWVSANVGASILDLGAATATNTSPTNDPADPNNWLKTNWQSAVMDHTYSIQRRPVPSAGAREVLLPSGVVIDATSSSGIATGVFATNERSRLPIQPGSLYVDIMLNPNGLYIPTTVYSTPTSTGAAPFLHFWITDRNDVFPIGSVWGAGNANPSNTATATYYNLPMTSDAAGPNPLGTTPNYPPTGQPTAPLLKNDRRLITLFGQSGMVVTNTIDSVPALGFIPGEGFNTLDVSQPFYKAQLGQREVK